MFEEQPIETGGTPTTSCHGGGLGGSGILSEIEIRERDYKLAVRAIEKPAERSGNNNKNFKTDLISKTDASSVVAYQEAIQKLKTYLQRYNSLLESDIKKLTELAHVFYETDMSLS